MVNRRQLLKISALGTASFAAPMAYSASKITMAYNTGNPPGSTSPKDLIDNAEDLDYLMTGSGASHPNRLGVPLKSWKGMEAEHNADQARRENEFDNDQSRRESEFDADQARRESEFDEYQARHESEFDAAQIDRATQFNFFMDASGYEEPIPYAAGIVLSRVTKTVLYLGNIYRVRTEFMPLTTTNWATDGPKLKLVGDDSLRQDMANTTDLGKGGAMLGRGSVTVESLADLSQLPKTRKLTAMLQLKGKSGSFYYDSTNLSAMVTADPLKGVYVPPASDPTGATGAWVRQYGQAVLFDGIKIDWFGAGPDDPSVDSAPAFYAATFLAKALAGTFVYASTDVRSRVMVSLTAGKNYYVYSTVALNLEGARVDFGCISGKANIIGANPATPTVKNPLGFSYDVLYDTTFKNISFISFGKIHEWDTDNVDSAVVIYDHCEFHNSGVSGVPVIDTRSFAQSRSTELTFIKCKSSLVPRLLNSYCDILNFIGGTYRNADPNGSLVLADSGVITDGGLWVPYFPGDNARWFDLYDNLVAGSRGLTTNGTRFSPENGGIPIVYNFMNGSDAPTNRFTNSIVINGGSSAAAPGVAAHTGLVVLADDGAGNSIAPSMISINGSVRSRTGLVRTQSGNPVNKVRGRFAIQISAASQSHLSTQGTAPGAPLVEAQLNKFVVGDILYKAPFPLTGSAAMEIDVGQGGPNATFNISGSGSVVNSLTGAFDGEVVTLVFQNNGGVVKDVSVSGDMYLAGGVNFTTGAFGTITLERQRAGNKWIEKSRCAR